MTVTAETTNPPQLSEHDCIAMTADDNRPPQQRVVHGWVMGANFHLYPDTPIRVRVYADEHRVVVHLGRYGAELDLFADADQLDRLLTLLSAVRQRLP